MVPSQVKVPTLVMHRSENPIFPPEHGHAFAAAISLCKFVPVKGMWHLPNCHFYHSISEGQLFIYFYFIFMYDALGLTQQCLSMIGKQPTLVDMINIWGYLIITGIGLLILFIANGGAKGRSFVSKFFAFSFTVGFKYGIALIILEVLSPFISPTMKQSYDILVYLIVNLLMVANIAFRIYETR